MSGAGFLVENDQIYNIEQSMNDSMPLWFREKGDTKAAREEYKRQMERDEAAKANGQPT